MIFISPGAVALKFKNIIIYWYGIFMALAFFVAFKISLFFAKKNYSNFDEISNHVYNLAFYLLVFGIIGARLYYVLLNTDYYFNNPFEIIMLNHGGISIHGGIIGAILSTVVYCKLKKLSFHKYADILIMGVPIGQAIGRWGNFFNSEAFGLPTDFFLKVFIPFDKRPEKYIQYAYFHPTFLYEFLWNICVFIMLIFISKKYYKKNNGIIFYSYLILYSLGRIFIEFIRVDSVFYIMNISIAVWISILTIILAIIMIFYRTKLKQDSNSNVNSNS